MDGAYPLFVVAGVIAGLVVASRMPRPVTLPGETTRWRLPVGLGAVLGAYLFELPADLCGWADGADGSTLGGRTVLGGILGGWATVEVLKRVRRIRGSTGDAYAAPLAASLTVGRIGCVLGGCCAGVEVPESSPWAILDLALGRPPRFPATLVESYFHAAALVVLVTTMRAPKLDGLRFPLYVGSYALLRIALEEVRCNPPMCGPLTWYQLLALALLAAAVLRIALTLAQRQSGATSPSEPVETNASAT